MSRLSRWSESDVEILKAEWKTSKPAREIAEKLSRTIGSVYMKAHTLGLPKKEDPNKIKLSQSDLWWLKKNYPHMRTEICAMKLGISHRTCVRFARELGVEKTAQFMKETQAFTARKAKESHLANGTYPPKGVVNQNIAKGEAFRFQPGHSPSPKKQITTCN